MNEEVAESVIISVTPETVTSNGGVRRNSAGKANTKTSPSPLNSGEKHLPHYLRASTGSCHDFCKYGRKHDFEAKERRAIFRKFLGSHEIPNEKHNEKVLSPGERGKKSVSILKTTSPTETVASDQPKTSRKNGFSPSNKAEGSSGKSISIMVSTSSPVSKSIESVEHTPDHAEDFSDGPISIKRVISSPVMGGITPDGNKSSGQVVSTMPLPTRKTLTADGNASNQTEVASEEPFILKFETASTIKDRMNFPDSGPANLTEGSLKELVSMNARIPSPDETNIGFADFLPASESEGLSEESVIIEITNPPSIQKSIVSAELAPTDVTDRLSEGSMNMELGTNMELEMPPFAKISSGDFEHMPVTQGEEYPEEPLSMKVMTPMTIKKIVTSGEPSSTKLKAPLLIRKSKTSSGDAVAQTQNQHNQLKTPCPGVIRKKQTTKLKSMQPAESFADEPKVSKQKEIDASRKVDSVPQKTLSPLKKTMTVKLRKQKSLPSGKKITSSLTPRTIKSKVSSPLNGTGVSPRPSVIMKPKALVLRSSSAVISSRKKQPNKVNNSLELTKIGEKVSKPPHASLSPYIRKDRNTKYSSPAKTQENLGKGEEGSENVKEKTLYVVSLKPMKKDSKPVQQKFKSSRASLSSKTFSATSSLLTSPSGPSHDKKGPEAERSESVVGIKGTKSIKLANYTKIKDRKIIRSNATVHPDAEMPAPHKLKFRRGKVINPHMESNGPRILRFRERVINEIKNGKEAEKKSFRGRKELVGPELNKDKLEAPAVLLRRQDQQEKKETQGLFNHVIEETASKLVETRKSKVKALVGAFETVISLQETKAAPTV